MIPIIFKRKNNEPVKRDKQRRKRRKEKVRAKVQYEEKLASSKRLKRKSLATF